VNQETGEGASSMEAILVRMRYIAPMNPHLRPLGLPLETQAAEGLPGATGCAEIGVIPAGAIR
jgi:hypothetical protein